MRPLVGVLAQIDQQALKRHIVLCDRLAFAGIEDLIEAGSDEQPALVADIEWLLEKEVLFDPRGIQIPPAKLAERHPLAVPEIRGSIEDAVRSMLNARRLEEIPQHFARLFAVMIREAHGVDAVALTELPGGVAGEENRSSVIRLVLSEFPIPNDSHGLQDLVEFAEQERKEGTIQGLRVCLNDLANSHGSLPEIKDKLEYLISQHVRALQAHRIQRQGGIIETVLVTTAEIAASLLTGRFRQALGKVVDIRATNAALMLEEMNLPGREVAYIVKARERFGK